MGKSLCMNIHEFTYQLWNPWEILLVLHLSLMFIKGSFLSLIKLGDFLMEMEWILIKFYWFMGSMCRDCKVFIKNLAEFESFPS